MRIGLKNSHLVSLFLCALLLSSASQDAFVKKKKAVVENFSGVVISCHDGNTCRVRVSADVKSSSVTRGDSASFISVRFAGIDAPEIKQPLGVRSKNFVESLIKNKTVNLECDCRDRRRTDEQGSVVEPAQSSFEASPRNFLRDCAKSYNRITCTVFQAGVNINSEIVRAGWAYESKRYSKGMYTFAENQARTKKLGIWQDDRQVSPYCYRKKSKHPKCQSNPAYQD